MSMKRQFLCLVAGLLLSPLWGNPVSAQSHTFMKWPKLRIDTAQASLNITDLTIVGKDDHKQWLGVAFQSASPYGLVGFDLLTGAQRFNISGASAVAEIAGLFHRFDNDNIDDFAVYQFNSPTVVLHSGASGQPIPGANLTLQGTASAFQGRLDDVDGNGAPELVFATYGATGFSTEIIDVASQDSCTLSGSLGFFRRIVGYKNVIGNAQTDLLAYNAQTGNIDVIDYANGCSTTTLLPSSALTTLGIAHRSVLDIQYISSGDKIVLSAGSNLYLFDGSGVFQDSVPLHSSTAYTIAKLAVHDASGIIIAASNKPASVNTMVTSKFIISANALVRLSDTVINHAASSIGPDRIRELLIDPTVDPENRFRYVGLYECGSAGFAAYDLADEHGGEMGSSSQPIVEAVTLKTVVNTDSITYELVNALGNQLYFLAVGNYTPYPNNPIGSVVSFLEPATVSYQLIQTTSPGNYTVTITNTAQFSGTVYGAQGVYLQGNEWKHTNATLIVIP